MFFPTRPRLGTRLTHREITREPFRSRPFASPAHLPGRWPCSRSWVSRIGSCRCVIAQRLWGLNPVFQVKMSFQKIQQMSQDRVLTGGRDGADTRSARPSAAGLRLFFLLTGDDLVGLRRRAVQYTPCLRPENVPLSLICCSHSFTCAFIYPSVHPTNQRGQLRGQCPSLSLHVGRRRPGARSATHVPGPGPAHGPRRPCRAKPRRSRTRVRI